MRFSVIQLLLLTSCVAIVCASLKFANTVWWIVLLFAAMLAAMGIIVAILVGTHKTRTLCIGFSIGALTYCLLLWVLDVWEFDPQNAKLPTSRILSAVYFGAIRTVTRDPLVIRPDGDAYLKIGHLWWTIMFGFVGGQVAWLIRKRQSRTAAGQAAKTSVAEGAKIGRPLFRVFQFVTLVALVGVLVGWSRDRQDLLRINDALRREQKNVQAERAILEARLRQLGEPSDTDTIKRRLLSATENRDD